MTPSRVLCKLLMAFYRWEINLKYYNKTNNAVNKDGAVKDEENYESNTCPAWWDELTRFITLHISLQLLQFAAELLVVMENSSKTQEVMPSYAIRPNTIETALSLTQDYMWKGPRSPFYSMRPCDVSFRGTSPARNTKHQHLAIKVDTGDSGNPIYVLIVILPAGRLQHSTCCLLKQLRQKRRGIKSLHAGYHGNYWTKEKSLRESVVRENRGKSYQYTWNFI